MWTEFFAKSRAEQIEGFKESVRGRLRRAGWELRRINRDPPDPLRFLVEQQRFGTVLDIGANTGQFARRALRLFPDAVIHSFEPVPSVFAALRDSAAQHPRWHTHNLALGETEGSVEMEVNDFTPSSSLLPLMKAHVEAFPYTARTTKQAVRLTTLDNWARGEPAQSLESPLLIKMDVQGYEDRVLDGGGFVIGRASAIISEVSFVPLYAGQVLFDTLHERLHNVGFACVGFVEPGRDPRNDRPLYADAVFMRTV